MNKKGDILTTLLALLAIALLVGLAAAQEATRSHPTEVDPGAEFDVSIDVSDLGILERLMKPCQQASPTSAHHCPASR